MLMYLLFYELDRANIGLNLTYIFRRLLTQNVVVEVQNYCLWIVALVYLNRNWTIFSL